MSRTTFRTLGVVCTRFSLARAVTAATIAFLIGVMTLPTWAANPLDTLQVEVTALKNTVTAQRTDPASPAPNTVRALAIDVSSLPGIESIDAHSNVAVFLRPGVPDDLTRAALRKAWVSDPAIRDFVGIAENQWDFNNEGTIAGFDP